MTDKELQEKFPAYSKSIFSDFKPDNEEVLKWKNNVLEKVRGHSILPHYIKRDKDFNVFWGGIIHFFAIIVCFSRSFKKIFTDYKNHLSEVGEFMREKNYIKDSRVQINKDLNLPLTGQVYFKIFCNHLLENGKAYFSVGYDTTDYISIKGCSFINLKVLGYNNSINEYDGEEIQDIKICFYSSDKSYNGGDINIEKITPFQAKWGYKISLLQNENNCYIRISYPSLGNSSLPLYLGVFLEEDGKLLDTNKTEREIFSIYSDFRKRGTFKNSELIKKILESKEEEGFYADYLSQKNTGWFLNQNSPIYENLFSKIKTDSFIYKGTPITNNEGTLIIPLQEKYFILNQNTSLVVKWRGSEAKSVLGVGINLSVYDKEKKALEDTPILSDWTYNKENNVYEGHSVKKVYANVRYDKEENFNIAEFPINIIDNNKSALFSSNTYYFCLSEGKNNTLVFCKYNNSKTKEVYYVKVDSVEIYKNLTSSKSAYVENNDFLNNFDVSLCLRKLPITLGFLNNKKYYICCFKNNGIYSDKEAKELISQKVLPYDGYRIFIDNSFYKNDINIALSLKQIFFDRINKKICLEIKGGVPPYKYEYDNSISEISYLSLYEKKVKYGFHIVKITDSLGSVILTKISCQPYNKIDYKIKLYVGKDNSIQIFIKLFGGTESSYTILQDFSVVLYDKNGNQLLDKDNAELRVRDKSITEIKSKVVPANVWIDITDIVGSNFSEISDNISLYVKDNEFPEYDDELRDEYKDLILPLQDLLKNFALDFYDNGIGKLIN